MSASRNRGADALIGALKQAGVTRIFTLSGNHIMPVFDAVLDSGIELIHTRHEGATVHMADAWARLTGEVGIALVTGGPGHANAVSALYTAAMAESPVVLLSGHAANNQLGMGAFQEMRQADIAAPLTKASWTCAGPEHVAADMAKAMRIAASGRPGPVHLSLPNDALDLPVPDSARMPSANDFAAQAMPLAYPAAEKLIGFLRGAKRPMVLAGPACMTRRGRARLSALEAALGIPVVGTESPRGVGDPSLGGFAELLAQSDAVLLLGKRLDFTLKFGKAPAFNPACQFAQVDAEPAEIDRSRRAVGERLQITDIADAFSALDTLTAAAKENTKETSAAAADWLQQVKAGLRFRPPAWDSASSAQKDRLHPVQALRPLQAILDSHPDAVFVCDGGEIGQWAQACLQAPDRVINGVAGAIGAALPFALAARVARQDAPVIAVMGDGTFGFHSAEMDTAVRYGLHFICVVGNDARWNAEWQIQKRDYGVDRLIGCELLPTRYDQVTVAFGGHGELVTQAGEVVPAAQRALASKLPACLNIMIEGLAAPNVKL